MDPGPIRTEMDEPVKPTDELHAMFEAAERMHELFESFMVGGFTEDQALKLVASMMVSMSTRGSD